MTRAIRVKVPDKTKVIKVRAPDKTKVIKVLVPDNPVDNTGLNIELT